MNMQERLDVLQKHLKKIDDVISKGVYKDNWESLAFHKVPDWYRNSKLGIFIHWGVYSVPAHGNEWYPRWMYKKGNAINEWHTKTYGPLKNSDIRILYQCSRQEKYNAEKWAELFKEAGAGFVMPVAEHHDGFQMYDSELSEWCATKKGPCKDVLGMLKEEVEKKGMVFATSSHRVEHYWFMGGMRQTESDLPENLSYGDFYWPSYEEPFSEGKTNQTRL